MKKTYKVLLALMCCIGLPVVFTSCDDDDKDNIEQIDNNTEQPTEDAMEVMASVRTYVFNAQYTGTGAALVRRLSNTSGSLDETVQAAVIHDDCVASLDSKDYEGLIALIARGGCLVYTSATRNNIDKFIRSLQRTGKEMGSSFDFTEDGTVAYDYIMFMSEDSTGLMVPPSLQLHDTNGVLCDAYAFKGYDRYVVTDTDEPLDIATVTTEVQENGEEVVTNEEVLFPPNEEPSDYICGLHADGLAEWIDAEKDKVAERERGIALLSRSATKGDDFMDLEKVCNAYIERFSFVAQGAYKKAPVTVLYEVWPVNNTKGTDFYLVHQNIAIQNSKFKCGPTESNAWDKGKIVEYYGDKYKSAYHVYMASVKNEIIFRGGTANLDHVSPQNAIGSSSFSKTSGWSLSTSFINPNLSGSVSMSKTYVYNVSDLKLSLDESNKDGAIQWVYEETSKPSYNKTKGNHGQCKDIQKKDARFDYCWIWSVDNANAQYTFEGKTTVETEGLWNYNYSSIYGYKRFTTTATQNVSLPQPPRYAQEWVMLMYPSDKYAFDHFKERLSKYWKSEMELYTIIAEDTTEVNKWADKVASVVRSNPEIARDAFKGAAATDTITFSLIWKPEDEEEGWKYRTVRSLEFLPQ